MEWRGTSKCTIFDTTTLVIARLFQRAATGSEFEFA